MERLYLDVSLLEPPEPLEKILDTIEKLHPGQYLHVYHRREPFPLYMLLQDMKMKWRTYKDDHGMYHIYIWSEGDSAAEEKAMAQ